jgi:phosphatidylglycerol:prolipoprotein diacylglycerol transferase
MYPKLFSIGSFFLPTYGVLVAAAFLVALWMTTKLAKRSGLDHDKVSNLGVYSALSGLAGAKLLMFVVDYDYYWEHPNEILSKATLQAGGVFYGGLLLALAIGAIYMRRNKMPVAKTLDTFAPGLALGQGIGRIACYAAGCCWGIACDRSWAVVFEDPDAHQLVGVPLYRPLHPTQIYESISGFLIFAILYWLFGKQRQQGFLFGVYLVLAGAARFVVEFFRHHDQLNPFGGPLNTAQWISAGLFIVGCVMLLKANARRGDSESLPKSHYAAPTPP